MGERVSMRREGPVTLIAMDNGRVNAMSPAMIADVRAALEGARRHGGPVVLTGRVGVFCGGFDLAVMRSGSLETLRMIRVASSSARPCWRFRAPSSSHAAGTRWPSAHSSSSPPTIAPAPAAIT